MTPNEELLNDIYKFYSEAYYQVNALLVDEMGFRLAIFFEVILKWSRRVNGENRYDKEFYIVSSEMTKYHQYSYKQQYDMFNELIKLNLLESRYDHREKRKYIKINIDLLATILYNRSNERSERLEKFRKERAEYFKNINKKSGINKNRLEN